METTLSRVNLTNERIRGLEPKHIYMPPDIEKTWPGAWCILDLPNIEKPVSKNSSEEFNYRGVMAGMCGRARKGNKGNTLNELGCTTSHLLAMRAAVDSNDTSPYAIITEDDIVFPFDIDYEGIPLCITITSYQIHKKIILLLKKNQHLWHQHPVKILAFYSYLIPILHL